MAVLWMVFEAVAVEREAVEDSLEDHVDLLESEEGVEIIETQFDEISKMENPHPGIDEGHSQVCEVRVELETFAKAYEIAINYGPTYVQVEEPEKIEMSMKEGQESLQTVLETVHQYAQSGAGGMLISRPSDE